MSILSPEAVLEKLQAIFQEALDNPNLKITLASNANNTQDWDSLAHISIIEMVEETFKFRFALGELQDLRDVRDLVRTIIAKAK